MGFEKPHLFKRLQFVISLEYLDYEVNSVSFQLIFRDIGYIGLGTFENNLTNLKLLDTVSKTEQKTGYCNSKKQEKLIFQLFLRKITLAMNWKMQLKIKISLENLTLKKLNN